MVVAIQIVAIVTVMFQNGFKLPFNLILAIQFPYEKRQSNIKPCAQLKTFE